MKVSRLKLVLAERGISQRALAKKINIPTWTLCNIANGRMRPRPDERSRIARALRVSAKRLFGEGITDDANSR